jgi:hypothetical protein
LQNFWRKDGHLAAEGFDHRESGPHLMLMDRLERSLDGLGLDEGWLVMFDRRTSRTWDERLFARTATRDARRLHVVGC